MNNFDLDNLINDNFSIEEPVTNNDEFSNEFLNKYNLIIFTDGACSGNGKKDKPNHTGFGMYVLCNNDKSSYFNFNDTKIIKKIDKDLLFYNKNNYDLIYYNLTCNDSKIITCNHTDCTYYAIYNSSYCKIHKQDSMQLNIQYYQYSATNIRSEGYAILYTLIYIKIINIDKIKDKNEILEHFKIDKIKNIKKELKALQLTKKSNNKYLIVTDSEFWINVITKWMNGWINKNLIYDKKNLDIILYINYYYTMLINNNIEINFKHIKGHSDKDKTATLNLYQRGNVMADKLANLAKKNTNLNIKIV